MIATLAVRSRLKWWNVRAAGHPSPASTRFVEPSSRCDRAWRRSRPSLATILPSKPLYV